jgi:hypothetical protein
MTRKEAQENIAMLKKVGAELRGDRKKALKFLAATGMYTADGELKERFRPQPMKKAD